MAAQGNGRYKPIRLLFFFYPIIAFIGITLLPNKMVFNSPGWVFFLKGVFFCLGGWAALKLAFSFIKNRKVVNTLSFIFIGFGMVVLSAQKSLRVERELDSFGEKVDAIVTKHMSNEDGYTVWLSYSLYGKTYTGERYWDEKENRGVGDTMTIWCSSRYPELFEIEDWK